MAENSRTPQILADAAYAVITQPSATYTGQFLIDDEVLAAEGVTDFSKYLNEGGREEDLALDFC